MKALETTSVPGIFRRHTATCPRQRRCECSYVATWRELGRVRSSTHRTLELAREAKRTRESEVADGQILSVNKVKLHDYALEWIERYTGTGRRGFREETRDEYRRLLHAYTLKFFPPNILLTQITPRDVAAFVGWLVQQPSQRKAKPGAPLRTLSDSSVRNALGPLSALLATARREGLLIHNPASDAVLPHRPRIEEDEQKARPFPRRTNDKGETVETMELVVSHIDPKHRLMFELLAATGVRRSELFSLCGRHLHLHEGRAHIKIRQRVRRRRGLGLIIDAVKSRHSRRELPITPALAQRLASLDRESEQLLFTTLTATMLDPDNVHDRVLRPACVAAGVEWAGFHTFRHTVASRMFEQGRSIVEVQRWLGHHSPSFTLDTYVHLLSDTLGEPLQPIALPNASA